MDTKPVDMSPYAIVTHANGKKHTIYSAIGGMLVGLYADKVAREIHESDEKGTPCPYCEDEKR